MGQQTVPRMLYVATSQDLLTAPAIADLKEMETLVSVCDQTAWF